jgi:protein-tyrosine phosphatase
VTEIIENLFVGDMVDARAGFDGLIICVLEEKPFDEPADATWIPFLADGVHSLEVTADIIDDALVGGRAVLVHCGAGSARAPLAVAWFLTRRREMSLDEAYTLLRSRRPIVRDRRSWMQRYIERAARP